MPLGARLAATHGLAIDSIEGGSVVGGRVVTADVLAAAGIEPGGCPAARGALPRSRGARDSAFQRLLDEKAFATSPFEDWRGDRPGRVGGREPHCRAWVTFVRVEETVDTILRGRGST